jgi:WD40 repeat protein
MRYAAVSSIEHSHCMPITDIVWLPDHFELNRMGLPIENKSGQCCQLVTCATDHSINVWDIRAPKSTNKQQSDEKNLSGIPTTFKHLDLTWKPHLKITLTRMEPGGDHAPTKFSISEVQGDRTALADDDDATAGKASDTAISDHAGGMLKSVAPSGQSRQRVLKKIKTMLYVGTEDGEIVYVDWMPAKDQESGKIQTPKPEFSHTIHCGPIVTLQRSPFFRDVILCVGGWNFSIWKEGVTSSPILQSAASTKRLTSGHWSPSRPSVFFITKQDGSVDIWDLLDRTHEPCMNQSLSPAPITCIFPYQVTSKQHLLAVGDAMGTLHILAIPWSLRQPTPNELNSMSNYIDREVSRRAFVVERWNFREKEKMELEAEAKRKAGIAPQVVLSDEEIEHRMKLEYQAYLEEELIFMRELGLLKEESLPAIGEMPGGNGGGAVAVA